MVSSAVGADVDSATGTVLDAADPLGAPFRDAIAERIATFLTGQAGVLAAMGTELEPVHAMAAAMTRGGKRLRPAFCVWGYVAAAGRPAGNLHAVLGAAASLDLLHVSALVHDDVMDASDLRRGRPAAHRQFEAWHREVGGQSDPTAFGRAGAILLGDLLIMWSAQLLQVAGLEPAALVRALPVVEAMRTEVTCGQYLDMVAQARPLRSDVVAALTDANRVVEYKSARYTVQRPCQAGAAIGGGSEQLARHLAAYGSPLGRAFQFRDDLLGVFGDSALTGKPAGDDLREGKRTVLVAHAYAHAGPAGRALLGDQLGNPDLDADGVARLQDLIVETGAAEAVESMITEGYERALSALRRAEVTDDGRAGLTALADAAVRRRS